MSVPEETQQQRPPDVTEFWRQWLTESERQFNTFFNSSMNSEAFARTAGSYMEMYAGFQRLLAEGMQRYLTFVNMPSRNDVVGLGEMLRVIEARLARIEDSLLIGSDVAASDRGHIPYEEPARTRRPPGFPGGDFSTTPTPPPPPAPEPVAQAPEPSHSAPIPEPTPPALSDEAVAELLEASGRLHLLEERLGRIEETLRIAMEFMEATEAGDEEAPAAVENGVAMTAIPDELRR